jgi:hypothetical protein
VGISRKVVLLENAAEKFTKLLHSWEDEAISGQSAVRFEIISVLNHGEEGRPDGVQEKLKLDGC